MPGAAELAEAFARDGVVCVRAALDPAEVATAARGIEAVLASPGRLTLVASAPDDPGTVHGAPGFPFPRARRVLSLRYLSAGVTFAPRRWRTSPPFNGLDHELAAGADLDHPLFPIVWPADG